MTTKHVLHGGSGESGGEHFGAVLPQAMIIQQWVHLCQITGMQIF
jgi:hypothetical protein